MKHLARAAWCVAALAVAQAQTTPLVARFDWFSYQGRDPVYEKLAAAPDEYLNPILPGFYPDPSICRVGGDYYLVTSSFAYFPGVPIFHSTDLVHWTQIGHVLDRPTQLPLGNVGISRGVFAPTIRYHAGTFYMVTTLVDAGGNFLVTATHPAGPWSAPIPLKEIDGIDPSFFFDDDGRAFIANNGPPPARPLYEGHRALWLQEFDLKTKAMTGPRKVIVNGGVDISKKPIWIEGPHIFKVKGTYYLIAAEGGTAEQHSEVVFRSASVWGPWEPYPGNPILTQRHLDPSRPFPVTSTGHADFVETPDGRWWSVFLGARPYADDFYNTGRETFMLPVEWRDGWPHILDGTAAVPYAHRRPELPLASGTEAMKQGNFVERDEFSERRLRRYWTFIRVPLGPWYDLSSKPGWLTIEAQSEHIGKHAHPAFLGRRQQHAYATVTTAMQFKPSKPGDKAGLVAFQNDDFYYLLGVTLAGGKPSIQLEKSGEVIASAPLPPLAADGIVYLKIDANGATYDFAYGVAPEKWEALKSGVDGTFLSTKTAGGFVGSFFGMYAYRE